VSDEPYDSLVQIDWSLVLSVLVLHQSDIVIQPYLIGGFLSLGTAVINVDQVAVSKQDNIEAKLSKEKPNKVYSDIIDLFDICNDSREHKDQVCLE
jgi:hypothetical protein